MEEWEEEAISRTSHPSSSSFLALVPSLLSYQALFSASRKDSHEVALPFYHPVSKELATFAL